MQSIESTGPTKPILIVGAPGSGTTLLYQTLCCHRDVSYITHNMLRAGLARNGRFMGEHRRALFTLQKLVHRDAGSNLPHEADVLWMKHFGYYNRMTEEDCTDEMAAFFKRKILLVQKLWNRLRFLNKNLQNSFRVRLLNAIFPDAKFIHIVRDGRAVAFSILNKKREGATSPIILVGFRGILGDKYEQRRSELYNYGLAWAEYVRAAREAIRFGPSGYYEVRYEDLVASPRDVLKRILEFCELEWHDEFEKRIPAIQNMNIKWNRQCSNQQRQDMEESTFALRKELGAED